MMANIIRITSSINLVILRFSSKTHDNFEISSKITSLEYWIKPSQVILCHLYNIFIIFRNGNIIFQNMPLALYCMYRSTCRVVSIDKMSFWRNSVHGYRIFDASGTIDYSRSGLENKKRKKLHIKIIFISGISYHPRTSSQVSVAPSDMLLYCGSTIIYKPRNHWTNDFHDLSKKCTLILSWFSRIDKNIYCLRGKWTA